MGSILVLGGAGYIGSHTVYELIDAGKDVVVGLTSPVFHQRENIWILPKFTRL